MRASVEKRYRIVMEFTMAELDLFKTFVNWRVAKTMEHPQPPEFERFANELQENVDNLKA
jgi:hypothetical protein